MTKLIIKIIQFFLFAVLLLLQNIGFAQFNIPDVPDFQTSVYDYAKVLSESEAKQLEQKLINYSDSTSTQIVFISIDDLKGESIGLLTPKWAHEWGIGQGKEDNGVLVLLAKNDREIWISPGYGVEDRLTAGITGEIVRDVIIPEFKAGSYYNGLDKGSDAIFEVLKGKYQGSRKSDKDNGSIAPFLIFLFIIIIFVILASKNKNNRNGGSGPGGFRGPSLGDMIILSSLGRSGGFGSSGGGSFGGGGFGGGFGGGGFSGGGAGGSW